MAESPNPTENQGAPAHLAAPAGQDLAAPAGRALASPTARISPQSVVVSPTGAGRVETHTFLEKWGVVFVGIAGGWILLASSAMLIYFVYRQPALPNLAGLTPEQAKDALAQSKQLYDQWRDSLSSIFDLLVTKTALPIVTLLLGYLFGKAQSSS